MSASRKWLAVPTPSTGRPTPCGTLCPPPTRPRPSPVVGRNQCSLMLMRVLLRTSGRTTLKSSVKKSPTSNLPGSSSLATNASAISCSEAMTSASIGDGLGDRAGRRRLRVTVGGQAGLLGPDLGPLVAVGVGPDLRLGEPAQVVLERRGGGLVLERVAGWRPGSVMPLTRPLPSARIRALGLRPRPARCTGPRSPRRRRARR